MGLSELGGDVDLRRLNIVVFFGCSLVWHLVFLRGLFSFLLLFILESDLVAYQSQVLPQNSVKVPDFLRCEYCELEDNKDQVEHAQNGLKEIRRSLCHSVILSKLLY